VTADEVKQAITFLEAGLDVALPVLGQAELVPIANALGALAGKVTDAVAAAKAKQDPTAAEVAAVDAAAQAALDAKFPKG
jgi:hypothetical protein